METWIYNDNFKIPSYLQNYQHIFSMGNKTDGSTGRASGGISIFIKNDKNYTYETIEIKNSHIIIDIFTKTHNYRLIVMYWRPQIIFTNDYIESLENLLYTTSYLEQENYEILIFGDFNARIGKLDTNYHDENIFLNSNLLSNSVFPDKEEKNTRGIRLLNLMQKIHCIKR